MCTEVETGVFKVSIIKTMKGGMDRDGLDIWKGGGNNINLCLVSVTNMEKLCLVSLLCISSCFTVFWRLLFVYTDPNNSE